MGRYDKIAVNSSGWKTPTQMYVWNGSSWVDYGTSTSYTTTDAYVWDGSWKRVTLNRQDYTTYNTASDKFVSYTGTSTALSITSGTITVKTKRQYATWGAYLNGMMSDVNGDWWAGTNLNNDGTEDWHQYVWSSPMWVYRMRYMSPQSTYYNACPKVVLVRLCRYSSHNIWDAEQTYSHSGYTAQNQWGAYWTFNAQGSYYGVQLRYYNNTTYHTAIQSTRIGRYSLDTGTISSGTNWV